MPYRIVSPPTSESETQAPIKGKFRIVQKPSFEEKEPEHEKSKRSFLEKAARVGAQYGIGALEAANLPYELAVAPLASKSAQNVAYRKIIGEHLEDLIQQRKFGKWTDQDQELYDSLVAQLKDPSESAKFTKAPDLSIRGLAEKATGIDLHPEGVLEKAASWTSFIRNPIKLLQKGGNPKEIIRALTPTKTEALRGLAAGEALEGAEQGDFGPIGTIASAIVGDVSGSGLAGVGKVGKNLIRNPKATLAKSAAKLTSPQKRAIQQGIIQEFRNSGIQADVGTLTDNYLVKMIQSRLAQSGFTGKALDDLRSEMTNQIKKEYGDLANSLGSAKFATTHEAGEVAKSWMQKIRDLDKQEYNALYDKSRRGFGEDTFVDASKLISSIHNLEKELLPGSIKSTEQKAVLDALDKIKGDITTSSGKNKLANVKNLMNDKIGLNDMINYEVQGGAKQLLKGLTHDIDRAIISASKDNPVAVKNYINANRRFSAHAKTFRNPKTTPLLKEFSDPEQIFNKMNSVEGIRHLRNILLKSPNGQDMFNALARLKLEEVIGKNLVDSTTQQIKLGTFSKLLEKGKNRSVIKEILGAKEFQRLERLQKNVGKLSDTANKFYNASKTASSLEDIAVVVKAMKDIIHLLSGNPFPLIKTGTGIVGARYISKLISDPKFLNLVEDAILASSKNNTSRMLQISEEMIPIIRASMLYSKAEQS